MDKNLLKRVAAGIVIFLLLAAAKSLVDRLVDSVWNEVLVVFEHEGGPPDDGAAHGPEVPSSPEAKPPDTG